MLLVPTVTADKMLEQDVRGVQRMLKFGQELSHEHLVPIRGHWEQEDVIYIVEDYIVRGDLLQVRARPCRVCIKDGWSSCRCGLCLMEATVKLPQVRARPCM